MEDDETPSSQSLGPRGDPLDLLGHQAEQDFDNIAELAAAICGAPYSLVSFLGRDWQYHKASVGLPSSGFPLRNSFCRYTVQQHNIFIVSDAQSDPRFEQNPLVTGEPWLRFYAGVPLYSAEGHPLGALCVLDTIKRELKDHQARALKILAQQVNILIEFRAVQREARQALSAAQAGEQLFRDFADNVPLACFLKDRSGRLCFYNAHFAKLFRIGPEEWISKTCAEIWPPELAAKLHRETERTFELRRRTEVRLDIPGADGSRHTLQIHQVPCRSSLGEPMLAGAAMDVSHEA